MRPYRADATVEHVDHRTLAGSGPRDQPIELAASGISAIEMPEDVFGKPVAAAQKAQVGRRRIDLDLRHTAPRDGLCCHVRRSKREQERKLRRSLDRKMTSHAQ